MRLFDAYAQGPVRPIGQGMEGAVHDLGGDLVGKRWFTRTATEVLPLQAFGHELLGQRLPFRTPDLRAVATEDGRAVSVEAKLAGRPLDQALADGSVTQEQGFDAFAEVVRALGRTEAGPATAALPMLDEPFRKPWGEAFADLVLRRAQLSRSLLEDAVDGFAGLLDQVARRLPEIVVETPRVVHGDICPPNLLVGDTGRLTAVLDWGFLTTAGDNTFDAATAAGFYDMYGPDARTVDDELLARFEADGHSRERMLLYRAAYAITTATVYNADGSDGHFAWCVGNLNRPDVRAAL
ncbi:phosphotransferase family enzyme [Kribbella amoyensis]|uniref:Phosphotransferase family enzyme n=1 Tax=Kribbella amoyensis TaxID=996641 RepID=A0A561B8X2_9ACTN|nr:aminoglycoside phosphotransferase family protein [Kribbella amoyensis]TWD75310.1 phosphotransferase family enzyme [Kribbella amoyensis]